MIVKKQIDWRDLTPCFNRYTKFKKHKNMSNLSSADMAHIFGEKKVEEQVQYNNICQNNSEVSSVLIRGLSHRSLHWTQSVCPNSWTITFL